MTAVSAQGRQNVVVGFGIKGRLKTFSALRHRDYRLLWFGTFVSSFGDWIDQIALNWLVVQITDSPVYLGLVNLCRGLPILIFTLLGGAMADRSERRSLMVATQGSAMVLALVLAGLVYTDVVTIWLVLGIATLRGALASVNLPARHSLISDLVPREDLANAIALNSLTRNITKVLGPALAGVLIGLFGTAACFAVNAATFVAVLVSLLMMKVTTEVHAPRDTGIVASLLEGFNFVWRHETIGVLVLIAIVPTFFGQNYISMLTLFARDAFRWGPEGLGLLTACAAFGSVLGALALASVPKLARSGTMMLVFLICFGVFLVAFALTPWVVAAPLLLLGAGASQIAYNATNNTILQMTVPDAMRGRVLSTLHVNKGLASLGTATVATLAALMGERWALASMAIAIVLLGTWVYFKATAIRKLTV